jgi:hypothetical protein
MKPNNSDDFSVTRAEAETASRKFQNSTLGRELLRLGIDIEPNFVNTNFKRLERITGMAREPTEDYNLTLMGRELKEKQSSQANRGRRIVLEEFNKYLAYCKSNFPTWSYWMEKEFNSDFTSKAAVEPLPMAETLSWYNAPSPLGEPDSAAMEKFQAYMVATWNELATHMSQHPEIKLSDIDGWRGRMNWNRNSGHPYWMPISEERFMSIDWPQFRDTLLALTQTASREALEAAAEARPGQVPNANAIVYGFFMRPPDRVVHAAELYWKGPGACATANLTPNLRSSRIAWSPVTDIALEFQEALVDATVIVAEDLKKFDRSIPKTMLKACYDAFWDSDFAKNMPEFRNIIGALLYILTKDGQLQLSATARMVLKQGLPSGHPLTQMVGSVIHLSFYEWWRDEFGWNPSLEKVLSDDGISVHKDISLEEMDKFIFGDAADTVASVGMLFHPDKTKLCDPTDRKYVGQWMGEEVYQGDNTFFLKRSFGHKASHSFGNPAGVLDSLLQSERPASDEFSEMVDKYLISKDEIRLGGRIPKAVYDIVRCVDIIASAGIANPLVDDYIRYVRTTWPGFEKRGVKYLTELLDENYLQGAVSWAGGTLDSGIHRAPVVEALLDLEGGTTFWDERAF